jgi:hypothetical protein
MASTQLVESGDMVSYIETKDTVSDNFHNTGNIITIVKRLSFRSPVYGGFQSLGFVPETIVRIRTCPGPGVGTGRSRISP